MNVLKSEDFTYDVVNNILTRNSSDEILRYLGIVNIQTMFEKFFKAKLSQPRYAGADEINFMRTYFDLVAPDTSDKVVDDILCKLADDTQQERCAVGETLASVQLYDGITLNLVEYFEKSPLDLIVSQGNIALFRNSIFPCPVDGEHRYTISDIHSGKTKAGIHCLCFKIAVQLDNDVEWSKEIALKINPKTGLEFSDFNTWHTATYHRYYVFVPEKDDFVLEDYNFGEEPKYLIVGGKLL